MLRLLNAIFLLLVFVVFYACKDDVINEKYERPEWLSGKVYTQVAANDSLSTFAKCLELVGFDTIINVSGSYTVLAPTNDAFNAWLQERQYPNIEAVPIDELTRLVKYHIIQNPWSKNQLRSLGMYGWIDSLDLNNNQPLGYKRITLLMDENRNYGIRETREGYTIVDTLQSTFKRKVITDSRKFAPFFYDEFFAIHDLSSYDYEYYFDRPFIGGDEVYFANSSTIGEEIFAENGFVFKVDQVVEPALNAAQLLDRKNEPYQYSKFLDLVNHFPVFEYNEQETKAQPGAALGLLVDSLFDISYPELVFDICNELSNPPAGIIGLAELLSIRFHHGLFAPTNEALDRLISEYIAIPGGWGNINVTPRHIKRIIVNTHMSYDAVYPGNMVEGIFNGEEDVITFDESTVVEKAYGSNCTFVGLNTPIVPRAFSSVTGPIYLRPGYSTVMYAIEKVNLLPALKRKDKNYLLFVESDFKLGEDSSLVYDQFKNQFTTYQKSLGQNAQKYNLTANDLRTLLLNHVAVERPKGLARKEFLPNMAGNFIIVNNETGEVSGTAPTTEGYMGAEQALNFPRQISTNADNGITYEIDNWFSFSTSSIYFNIQNKFPAFFEIMKQAGLVNTKTLKFDFLSENEFYTIFAPNDEALNDFDANMYTKEELAQIVKLHFVQGAIVFTDGNKASGYYETMRKDEKSTNYSTFFTKLYLNNTTDFIGIRDNGGTHFTSVIESEKNNILAGSSVDEETAGVYRSIFNNAVIHEIDRLLTVDQLDTN